jgi:hypothetical protein
MRTRFDAFKNAVSNYEYFRLNNIEAIPTKSHTVIKEDGIDLLSIDWGERQIKFISRPASKQTRRAINSILFLLKTGYKMEDKNNEHVLRGTGGDCRDIFNHNVGKFLKRGLVMFEDNKVIDFYR